MNGLLSPAASTPETPLKTANQRIISCRLCQQRKVKCDKVHPSCSYCLRHKLECVYLAPVAPKRKKRRSVEEELAEKLKQYELLLRAHNIPLDSIPSTDAKQEDLVDRPKPAAGLRPWAQFINEGGKLNFIESGFWNSLSEELQGPTDMLRLSSESIYPAIQPECDFSANLLALNPPTNMTVAELKAAHPQPAEVFRLWQIYLDNVNPITHIVHAPTFQRHIFGLSQNLHQASKPWDAMLFAIYLAAIQSMPAKEVQAIFGDSKPVLMKRYQIAVCTALMRADFTNSSDLLIVQALVLYLQAISDYVEPNTLWVLSGVTLRIAQRLGLHRDGSILGLSPFETETRRRVWYRALGMDSRVAEVCGAGLSCNPPKSDTKPYLNVNDSDLTPTMSALPREQEGPTEMMFCKFQSEIGAFLRHWKDVSLLHILGKTRDQEALDTRIASYEEMKTRCEQKYLKYCDPSVPLHLFTHLVGHASLLVFKLIVKYPRRLPAKVPIPTSREEQDEIWTLCLRILELYTQTLSEESIQHFLWDINIHFQWHAFVLIAHELCHRTEGEETEKAWELIGCLLDRNSDVITNQKSNLHAAVLRLVSRAWRAREQALQKAGKRVEIPEFVTWLQSEIVPAATDDASSSKVYPRKPVASLEPALITEQQEMQPSGDDPTGTASTSDLGTSNFLSQPIDWSEWDNLLSGGDIQNTFWDASYPIE